MEEMKHETDTREIRDDKPRILDLSLCYKWYDMIESGEKTEEYREIKDYWLHRLTYIQFFTGELTDLDAVFAKRYDAVRFHRGQGGKLTMLFEFEGLTMGFGKPEWGAPTDKQVFIIRLGKRVDKTEPIVLGWTRDEKGNVVDRHPVEVANAVTAAKRDNTQNYVIEQIGRGFNNGGQHDICPTISSNSFECNNFVLEEIIEDIRKIYPNRGIFLHDGKIYFIRKLTPRECFRLMGVSDADIDKIQAAGISKSQQYKMAGNSICVPTLTAILRQLFIGNFNKVVQIEIF